MQKHFSSLPLLLFLSIAGCATQKNDDFLDQYADTPDSALLSSTDWLIISAYSFNENGYKKEIKDLTPADGRRIKVHFSQDGQLNLSGGCNSATGIWNLTENQLKVSPLGSTRMMCEPVSMEMDAAALSLFSGRTITARVPSGLDNSLIRMQTDDNKYYVLQSINNQANNNHSYAGRYFSDDIFKKYLWTAVDNFNPALPTPIKTHGIFQALTLSLDNDQLTVNGLCGKIQFNASLNKNAINIGQSISANKACQDIKQLFANKSFTIQGQMMGDTPKIEFKGPKGSRLILKGKKKQQENMFQKGWKHLKTIKPW